MDAPASPPAVPYWVRVRRVTLALLLLWVAVTLALPWFARDLDVWQVGGFPLGFWMTAHGSILFYLLVLALDAWWMDRIDAERLI